MKKIGKVVKVVMRPATGGKPPCFCAFAQDTDNKDPYMLPFNSMKKVGQDGNLTDKKDRFQVHVGEKVIMTKIEEPRNGGKAFWVGAWALYNNGAMKSAEKAEKPTKKNKCRKVFNLIGPKAERVEPTIPSEKEIVHELNLSPKDDRPFRFKNSKGQVIYNGKYKKVLKNLETLHLDHPDLTVEFEFESRKWLPCGQPFGNQEKYQEQKQESVAA